MKIFFKIDFYLQVLIFIGMVSYLIFEYITANFLKNLFYFYYIVGGFQIFSFFIRIFLNYKKSKSYKIYGILLIPVWITLLLSIFLQGKNVDLGIFNQLGMLFYLMLYSAFFYAPILSVIYLFDIKQNIEKYEKSTI